MKTPRRPGGAVIDTRGMTPDQSAAVIREHPSPGVGQVNTAGSGPTPPGQGPLDPLAAVNPQVGPLLAMVNRRSAGRPLAQQQQSVATQMGGGFRLNATATERSGAANRIRPLSAPRLGEVSPGILGV